MKGYILKRILRSILSLIIVVFIIMLLVFQLMNKDDVFKADISLNKHIGNDRISYKYSKWEDYGYLDLVTYSEYVQEKAAEKGVSYSEIYILPKYQFNGNISNDDNAYVEVNGEAIYIIKDFKDYYTSKGYTIIRNDENSSTDPAILFAYKEYNVFYRLWDFFSHLLFFDNVNYAKTTDEFVANYGELKREIKICIDPLNGWPCVMGSGTKNKYLLYFDSHFPFIHQNFVTLNLGVRYENSSDFFEYFISPQGGSVNSDVKVPSGEVISTSYNFHERKIAVDSNGNTLLMQDIVYDQFSDWFGEGEVYTQTLTFKDGLSMLEYSFIIGIISTILVYIIGIPLGLVLALKKDKIIDKIGNFYIIFIMAVPSLAYIYLFSTIGNNVFGLPNVWGLGSDPAWLIYVLPIISLALPSIANIMKWVRRYMIDQMTSDYVKFARSQGFSEGEIFRKHILKNALIPIVHGIPASILGALTGAIITERVYGVPGMGKLLTNAINICDNGVIVGLSFLYAFLSIVSLILGDVLIAKVDPRISFAGGGGRK